jgi:hypothetical protein
MKRDHSSERVQSDYVRKANRYSKSKSPPIYREDSHQNFENLNVKHELIDSMYENKELKKREVFEE